MNNANQVPTQESCEPKVRQGEAPLRTGPVITRESEVQELCAAVGLTVQAVESTPRGVMIVTISPTRTYWKTLNDQLFRQMNERGTRWYSVVHHTMLGEPYSELWFTPL